MEKVRPLCDQPSDRGRLKNRTEPNSNAATDAIASAAYRQSDKVRNLTWEQKPGARFVKYLTTVLRSSYDNAKVTTDLLRTYGLQNILRRTQG